MPTPWWRDAVVYQIYPRSFADGSGDGVGDIAGITSKLDYLHDLGVDALWLSPIFTSPMADFGYDVADYCDVDPVFGNLSDVDALIAGLHDRGMRLLLDWVPNHTSDQHRWFVESRSSRDADKRRWYVWRDPLPDGSPPTNWGAAFSDDPAWTFDEATGQYYLHLFLPEQPDLNWANPEVEAAMHDTLRFWLDRGVDGFRADVVHLIGKGEDIEDLPEALAPAPVIAVDRARGHDYLRRIRTLLDGYPHEPMMIGEVYLLEPGQAATYLGDGTSSGGELHLTFDFRLIHTTWDADAFTQAIGMSQEEFDEPRWPSWVLSNHDERRHRTRYGSEERARAAAVVSLTIRGTPFLYAGEELGLEDGVIPTDRVVDPGGRDGCRAPIPWTRAGTTTEGHGWGRDPWLPFPANAATHAAEDQVGRPGSMHDLYRRLLALRRGRPVLRRGSFHLADATPGLVRYDRRLGGDRVTVVVNMAGHDLPVPADLRSDALLISSDPDRVLLDADLHPDEAIMCSPPPAASHGQG